MGELEALSREYRQAEQELADVRERLAAAIVAAARAGTPQREIVATTGYTRERVRQICRAAGIESTR